MVFFVTGGSGFIGTNLVRYLLRNSKNLVVNIDSLTYAGSLENLKSIQHQDNYVFKNLNINNTSAIRELFAEYKPDRLMHLAAESHVDRSIEDASNFIDTNIIGTYNLLIETRNYLKNVKKDDFRFHHISTDEVYGDLQDDDLPFTEMHNINPSSPYAASKASSDHLVRSWHRTYNLPVVISNCSNNYGPYQFPEKLIPLCILNALEHKPIPIYGNGKQIRDWIFVDDHVEALFKVAMNGDIGETYNIGSNNELRNIDLVYKICEILDKVKPLNKSSNIKTYKDLIEFVDDRAGHDYRYAIDSSKIIHKLGWRPNISLEEGLKNTVNWYLDNLEWCSKILLESDYQRERLGIV